MFFPLAARIIGFGLPALGGLRLGGLRLGRSQIVVSHHWRDVLALDVVILVGTGRRLPLAAPRLTLALRLALITDGVTDLADGGRF